MATGDSVNPKRARFQGNQRLDHVDQEFLTKQSRTHLDALSRSALSTPLASSAAAVGLVLTGGSVTENPTSGTDGLLRVNSELFVALDADGRMLVKPAGTALTVSIPAGGSPHQIYAYFYENPTEQAKRRAIPVTTPFTEYTITPYTRAEGSVNLYVRAGGVGSVVAADTVNGVQTALVFVGIATNAAGVVTFDDSAADNKLHTVKPQASRSSGSTANGSARTIHELLRAGLYELARTKYTDQGGLSGSAASTAAGANANDVRITGLSGMNAALVGHHFTIGGADSDENNGTFLITNYVSSTVVDVHNPLAVQPDANDGALTWSVFAHDLPEGSDPPAAGTNYGAWAEPRQGLDAVDRASWGYVTIGNGTSSFGTFDQTEFASDDLLLKAAINAVVGRGGGTIVLKPGVRLADFDADVDFDHYADPTINLEVTIEGWQRNSAARGAGDSVIETGAFKVKTPVYGKLTLRNLSARGTGTCFEVRGKFEAHDCLFVNSLSATASILTSGTDVSEMRFFNCTFVGEATTADDTKTSAVEVVDGSLSDCDFHFESCSFYNLSLRRSVTIDVGAGTSGGKFVGCRFEFLSDHGSELSADTTFVYLTGVDEGRGVAFSTCRFKGSATDAGRANYVGIRLHDAGNVSVDGCHFDHVLRGISLSGASTTTGKLTVCGCHFSSASAANAASSRGIYFAVAPVRVSVEGCIFNTTGFTVGAPQTAGHNVQGLSVRGCHFLNSAFGVVANSVVNTFGGLLVEGCTFYNAGGISPVPPIVSMNTTNGVARLTWRGNVHSGYSSSGASDVWLGLRVVAYEIDALVSGNAFRDINAGITYAGSAHDPVNGGPNRLLQFDAFAHRLTIEDNVGERLGTGSSGADLQQVTCIDVGVKARGAGADAGSNVHAIISGNRFGDDASACSFLHVGSSDSDLQVAMLKVLGNQHRSAPNVASTSVAAYGWSVQAESSVGTSVALKAADNEWWIDSPVGTLAQDWFVLGTTGGGVTIEIVSMVGDSVAVAGGAFAADRGLQIDADVTVRNFMFSENVASVPGAATNPVMYTDLDDIGSYGPIYQADPGAGTNWPGNHKIRRV